MDEGANEGSLVSVVSSEDFVSGLKGQNALAAALVTYGSTFGMVAIAGPCQGLVHAVTRVMIFPDVNALQTVFRALAWVGIFKQ